MSKALLKTNYCLVSDAAHQERVVEPFDVRMVDGEELLCGGRGVEWFVEVVNEFCENSFNLLHSGGGDVDRRHGGTAFQLSNGTRI